MMFYREIENDNGIKRNSEQDETNNDNEDAQILKTTNFSISEILRPEFGQRVKSEPTSPQSLQLRQEQFNCYPHQNDGASCKNPMLNFDDIFRRYKTFMCAASRYECSNTSGQLHSKTSRKEKEDTEQRNATQSSPSSPESHSSDRDTGNSLWPAWVYCTRYSDRPSAGPRAKKGKHKYKPAPEEKRPRTAFTNEQLNALKKEFNECRYLTEKRRGTLAKELDLSESQIKIWFQNKRAKIKKTSDAKNTLALNLIAEGLYNHSTVGNTPT